MTVDFFSMTDVLAMVSNEKCWKIVALVSMCIQFLKFRGLLATDFFFRWRSCAHVVRL